jgi:translation elongation factor EF-1beta
MAAKIFGINMDGLVWNKDFKLEPVAYGMNKLRIGCVVEDEKV